MFFKTIVDSEGYTFLVLSKNPIKYAGEDPHQYHQDGIRVKEYHYCDFQRPAGIRFKLTYNGIPSKGGG